MAKFKVNLGEDYLKKLNLLGDNLMPVVKCAVYEGAGLVADEIRNRAESVISDEATGEMMDSFGIAKIDVNIHGVVNTKIGWDGYDKKGIPNALKANALESGTSKQKKRPFVRPAFNATKEKATEKIEKYIDEGIKKIMK